MGVLDVIDTNINRAEYENIFTHHGKLMSCSDAALNKDVIGGIVKMNQDRGSSYFKIYQKTNVNRNSMNLMRPMNNSSKLEDYYKNYKTSKTKDSSFKENNELNRIILYNENNNPMFKHAKAVQGAKRSVTEQKKESDESDAVKADVNLLDLVKGKENCDLYVINTDGDLTDTIKKSFEKHGCTVSVSKVQQDLIALFILLNQKFSIKKLRVLIDKGKKFGIDFCLTKTGMTTILLSRIKQLFQM